jgi:halogenation protein CepH
MSEQFDVIVVGGGPGGSTAATFMAMQGRRVLLLEKECLPIYKIGESLLPSTVNGICPMLGVTDELRRANFVMKRGGTFRWGRAKEPWTFEFALSPAMSGPTSFAYQVERMKFDTILLNNARKKGVDVRERHVALEALFDDRARVCGLVFRDDAGQRREARCQFVVDASGAASSLGRCVGERIYSPFFRNVAVFGYFTNGKRLPPPNSGNIFSAAFDRGWFWYIPLSDTLTSVGAVIGREHAELLADGAEAALMQLIPRCEHVRDMLSEATRVTTGPYGEVRVRKDYSYCHTTFWRPGLVLVGDAACFIDPVFSSGVHLSTYSALLAARSINTTLAGWLAEDRAFSEYERRYRREYGYFYDFLTAFYNVDQDLDSYFWSARRVLESDEHGNEAFIRLVAGIGGSGEQLYSSTEAFLQQRPSGRQLFPSLPSGRDTAASRAADEKQRHAFMSGLLTELSQVQTQATQEARRAPEQPLFTDGLIPSSDGFHWIEPHGQTVGFSD